MSLSPVCTAEELRYKFSIGDLKLFYQEDIDVHKLKSECYSPSLREGALAESLIIMKGLWGWAGRGFSGVIILFETVDGDGRGTKNIFLLSKSGNS